MARRNPDRFKADQPCPPPDDTLLRWMHKHCRRNYWRVASSMQVTDLFQEGFVVYAYCRKKYSKVTSPKHFMSLYMTAFRRHVHGLARIDNQRRTKVIPLTDETNQQDEAFRDGELKLAMVIIEAPSTAIRSLLASYLEPGPVEKPEKELARSAKEYLYRSLTTA